MGPVPPLNRRNFLSGIAIATLGIAGLGSVFVARDALGPWRLTARRLIDRLEITSGGPFPGYRRNHAKGVAVKGHFDSNGNGAEISKATVFRAGTFPLVGRFSLGVGNPHTADTADAVRGLGLQIFLPRGEQWRTAMINLPVFVDTTADDFYGRIEAFAPDPATGKPDPARKAAYLASHPKTAAALGLVSQHPPTPSFATSAFFGLNAFEFTNQAGQTVPVRWLIEPESSPLMATALGSSRNALFDGLIRDVNAGPQRWKMVVVVGIPGTDPTHDATIPWPADRRRIEVGTVVIDAVQPTDALENVNFDPLVLPNGIAGSDDPIPPARSAAYAESYRRRAGEPTPRINI